MSKIIQSLQELNDVVPEGITFDLLGYESLTGKWYMEFRSFDELSFMPITDQFSYPVNAENFLSDIEENIQKFTATYKKYRP